MASDDAVARLAGALGEAAMELAHEVVEEGLAEDTAVCVVEGDRAAAEAFVARLEGLLGARAAAGELPEEFSVSAGTAVHPEDGADAVAPARCADERSYAVKRRRVR